MEELDGFSIEKGHGLYRPVGSVTFYQAVNLVRDSIAAARRNKVRDLLVDTTALVGFPSPETFQRFLMALARSDEAKGGVRLAMIARAEMIHPEKIGVTIAVNRGLVSNVFTAEAQARAWLKAQSDDDLRTG